LTGRAGAVRWRGGLLLAALAPLLIGLPVIVLSAAADPVQRPAEVQTYTIPPGTAARDEGGASDVPGLPRRIETRVGVALEVRNDDDARHVFGPVVLEPGQSWSREFAAPGEYDLACSVYPSTRLAIAVEPRATGGGWTDRVRWLAGLAWATVAVALGNGLGRRVSRREAPEPPARPGGRGKRAVDAPGARHRPLDAKRGAMCMLVAAVPATAVVWLIAGVVWLSRSASWRATFTSPWVGVWVGAAVLSAVGAGVLGRALGRELAGGGSAVAAASYGACMAALALALAPDLGAMVAASLAAALAGAGMLLAGFRASLAGSSAGVSVLGAAIALLLAGIPSVGFSPPATAVTALPGLAVGILLLMHSVGDGRGPSPGARGLTGTIAVAVITLQLSQLGAAAMGHIDATTAPVWGNPVEADAESIARGAAGWTVHCADCHESAEAIARAATAAGSSDIDLLGAITGGHATAPPLAYELDMDGRGDIVNYLRSLSPPTTSGGARR